MLWPFVRAIGLSPKGMAVLQGAGIGPRDIGNPDTRIAQRTVMELMERAVKETGDVTLGLKAADLLGPADLDVLDYAVRTCATLRDGAHCATRYLRLMNESVDTRLIERAELAVWEFHVLPGASQPAAVNDFELAAYANLARRYTGQDDKAPIEVHFTHPIATSEPEYQRVFRCPVRLGMPFNAIVFPRDYLDTPMMHANPTLHTAYEAHVTELLERQRKQEGVAGRAREIVLANLSRGQSGILAVAKELGMSEPTLRRRLQEEGTGHREIVDAVRQELALRYLDDKKLAISEVAFLLGFGDVPSFYKAFRRWHSGTTPADFRKNRA